MSDTRYQIHIYRPGDPDAHKIYQPLLETLLAAAIQTLGQQIADDSPALYPATEGPDIREVAKSAGQSLLNFLCPDILGDDEQPF